MPGGPRGRVTTPALTEEGFLRARLCSLSQALFSELCVSRPVRFPQLPCAVGDVLPISEKRTLRYTSLVSGRAGTATNPSDSKTLNHGATPRNEV